MNYERPVQWIIPGTEDLRPYITAWDKQRKWIMGTAGMAVIAAVLSGIMALILRFDPDGVSS